MLAICPNVQFRHSADKYLYGKHNMPAEPITLTSYSPKIYVPNVSLQKYLLDKLDKHSDQTLIECQTNTSHGFFELDSDCRRMANALKELGLKEGHIFGVLGENSYEYLVLYMAGIIVGAVVYGISSTESFQSVSIKVIQQNIKLIAIANSAKNYAIRISDGIPITQKIIVFNGGKKTNEKFILYSELIHSYDPINDEMIAIPNDPKRTECLIVSSSGCVSGSKAMVFSHHSVVSALEMTSYPQYFGYTQTEVVSSHAEFAHHISIFQILTAISTGSKIALMPKYDHKLFVNYVNKFKISAAILTSSAIISLVKAPEGSCEIPSLTKVISFGSVLPKTIANQLMSRYKHIKDLRQAFFNSRCMAPITLMFKTSSEYDSIGVAFPDTKIIVKELGNGDQLGANMIGEICVQKALGLCERYLNGTDAAEGLLDSNGWLHTRDLGYYDEDRLLYIIGSMDDMIKSNNILIAPSELESILLTHSAVSEAAVIAVPDDECGQTATAFVVLKDSLNGQTVLHTEIMDFANNQLPKRKKLSAVYVMKCLPKTIFGKIIKRQLFDELFSKLNKQKF